ncbi:hypothetical protein C8R44DRAFT_791664 [Mycena epipterygia]|nr:hypothetical protein C8R44DRAFT_791664 [Mycena epipterygia]
MSASFTSRTMDATNSAVPPTTHAIPHPDRLRLMRSMRKISAVLGETPVIDTTSSTPQLLTLPAPKRGFFFHASASLSSLGLSIQKSEPSHATHDDRPSLFLRLPDTFEPLPAPLSPSFSPTLMSPTSPEEETITRRLRCAKVSRTLGENPPPSLILPNPSVKRRRRASTLIMPESVREQQIFAATGHVSTDGEPISLRHARRPSVSIIFNTSTGGANPETPTERWPELEDSVSPVGEVHVHPLSPDTLLSPAEWLRPASRSSSPVPDAEPTTLAALGAPPTYEESYAHAPAEPARPAFPAEPPRPAFPAEPARPPFLAEPTRSYTAPAPLPHSTAPGQMQRREDGWTGEWAGAVGNMDDVVRGLRGLRAR